ncbi:protein of unknown function DUF1223 [Haliangium ochraceum DSM 14365]|uniref:DUF1223 domain-containing protein n=1 Tax=Haliangium ochraceum (strain DSM 14365 / JCM 11303 / SMP-2) TaxID=502025 RepID=D0LYP2_HALO1|nr:protein of unknown function DUF1223 [Haliangium ochraceum DSM 14365]
MNRAALVPVPVPVPALALVFALSFPLLSACAPSETRERSRAGAAGPVVIELFTSQGCSSCPPADRLLGELGRRDDVIALAFHVDYWNDLGWEDPFSSSSWSQRQRLYSHELPSRVYTPQLVIQGREHVIGSRRDAVLAAIETQAERPQPRLEIAIERSGDQLALHIDRDAEGPDAELRPVVALYESGHRTEVQAGENRNRSLQSDYVVRRLLYLDASENRATVDIDPAWTGALGVAVMLQDIDTMAIHAARARDLPAA